MHDLQRPAAQIAALALFRSLPFALYCLVSNKTPARIRVAAIVLWLALLAAVVELGGKVSDTRLLALGIPYFAGCGTLLYFLRDKLKRALGKAGLFGAVALLFMVLPAAIGGGGDGAGAVIVLGWGLMLSAYSYGVDAPSGPTGPGLRDCLFFLLVNPVVVYPERGEKSGRPGFHADGALRCLLGISAMALRAWLVMTLASGSRIHIASSSDTVLSHVGPFISTQGRLAVGLYLAHSGLASLQIGLMRQLGYRVPERYNYPFLAKSPQDFWNRWNIWVSSWAKRYVFWPMAARLRGNLRLQSWGAWGPSLAAFVAFLSVGVLHDAGIFAARWSTQGAAGFSYVLTGVFALFGGTLVAWRALEQKVKKTYPTPSRFERALGATLPRALLAGVMLMMTSIVVPALGGPGR